MWPDTHCVKCGEECQGVTVSQAVAAAMFCCDGGSDA